MAAVQTNTVLWRPLNVQVINGDTLVGPGVISIDLDCGYLREANGDPVSGSPGRMLRLAPPYPPGGIFRTWILKQ